MLAILTKPRPRVITRQTMVPLSELYQPICTPPSPSGPRGQGGPPPDHECPDAAKPAEAGAAVPAAVPDGSGARPGVHHVRGSGRPRLRGVRPLKAHCQAARRRQGGSASHDAPLLMLRVSFVSLSGPFLFRYNFSSVSANTECVYNDTASSIGTTENLFLL